MLKIIREFNLNSINYIKFCEMYLEDINHALSSPRHTSSDTFSDITFL